MFREMGHPADAARRSERAPTRRLAHRCAAAGVAAVALLAAGCGSSSSQPKTTTTTADVHGAGHHVLGVLAASAAYLGIERAKLRADLNNGETLAAIAESTPHHSPKGLSEAILRARQERLEAEQRAGSISDAQLETRLAELRRHIELRLEHAHVSALGVVTPATLKYLHISAAKLRDERLKGRSLAETANATPGHSAKGLIAAITAAEEAHLRATGHASEPGAQTPSEIETQVAELVNRLPATGASHKTSSKTSKAAGSESSGESSSSEAEKEGG